MASPSPCPRPDPRRYTEFEATGGRSARLAGVALSGCATIINGSTQSVSLDTPPAEGAQCTLTSSEGTWYVTTPGSVTVHKTKNDLNVVCKKDGYQDANATIPSKFGAATLGNVIAGGVVGVVVDAASGANYSYPQSTLIPMALVGASAPAAPSFGDAPADTTPATPSGPASPQTPPPATASSAAPDAAANSAPAK